MSAQDRIKDGLSRISGFTLVELLVAVSIMAILSTVGITTYQNARQDTTDARKRSDIDAIAQAYETTFDNENGLYRALLGTDFANSSIPASPDTTAYTGLIAVGQTATTYTVCATLRNSTQYCRSSNQDYNAVISGGVVINTPTPTPTRSL